jgi:hypothetical protein
MISHRAKIALAFRDITVTMLNKNSCEYQAFDGVSHKYYD